MPAVPGSRRFRSRGRFTPHRAAAASQALAAIVMVATVLAAMMATTSLAGQTQPAVSPDAAQPQPPQSASHPLNFTNDVLPVLTKFGCNNGQCHGRATGQNGFKLSLYGFDPLADYQALALESLGRRVDLSAPSRSLMLLKATAGVAHGGGVRFAVDSPPYRLLLTWIEQGTPWGDDEAPAPRQLQIEPAQIVTAFDKQHALKVIAQYSDGATRDVTALALYDSDRPDFLTVTDAGQVRTMQSPGEGVVMVRYQGLVGVARVTVPYERDLPDDRYAHFQPRNFIDKLALAKWRKLGIAPSAMADDATFLRRAHLDAIGTLPTPDEVSQFLADTSPDKRDKLIDRLLDRSEFGDLWALRWGDWLRNKQGDGDEQKENAIAFTHWMRDAMRNDMPYDQFVRAIVTVTGKLKDHPEMDWYRQVTSDQLRVEDTAQAFLGMRVACANCHNHPFEAISQTDYWQFAGFFARVDAKTYGKIETVKVKKEGQVHHPRTGEALEAKAFFGPQFDFAEGDDPRVKLVDWMTAPDNPFFARSLVNRVWAHFMGVGLVEAVDDMRATNPPSNPELLDALAKDFVEHGYHQKHLMKTIMSSALYGLSATPNEHNKLDTRNYARHYPRRLMPHVLQDAISDATGSPQKIDYFKDVSRAIQIPTERGRNEFLDLFGRTRRQTVCECETKTEPSLAQVLYFMYSNELQKQIADKDGVLAHLSADGKSNGDVVDALYLRVLSRPPSPDERKEAVALLDGGGDDKQRDQLLQDFMWSLLNTKDFLFNY